MMSVFRARSIASQFESTTHVDDRMYVQKIQATFTRESISGGYLRATTLLAKGDEVSGNVMN